MLFNLDFANNTNLSCFFFFILVINIYFLIHKVIFNPIVELLIPLGIPSKEAKAAIEIHLATAEVNIRNIQHNFELYKLFNASYSSIYFGL